MVVLIGFGISAFAQTSSYEDKIFENEKLLIYVQRINGRCIGDKGYQWFAWLYIVNKTNNEMRVSVKYSDVYKDGRGNNYTRSIPKSETVTLRGKEAKSFQALAESSRAANCEGHNFIENVELINYAVKEKNYETTW